MQTTLKRDNCKDCKSLCEHAGKDREFICPHGISCKVEYSREDMEKAAAAFVEAIKTISTKPANLDNLESYLSYHFAVWLSRYANSPENIAAEMQGFANMEF